MSKCEEIWPNFRFYASTSPVSGERVGICMSREVPVSGESFGGGLVG